MDKDEKTVKASLYKSILDLCYDKKDGLYYFCKFIIGGLKDIGYPFSFRYNGLLRKWDNLVKQHNRLAIMCARGHGKLCADSTPVLTTTGWKTHGNLIIGDKVYGVNGNIIDILNINKKDYANYIVEFSDGEKIRCHENHEWTLHDITKRKNPATIETKELIDNIKTYKSQRSRFFLPNIKPLAFGEKELSIDPYYLGLWLGDGKSYNDTISHSPNDMESIDSIKYELSSRSTHKDTGVVYSSYAKNNLYKHFKNLNLYNNKHIPEIYKQSSIEQRLELLAGLIDSDGSVAKNCNKIRIVNTNKKIIDACVEILRSLGLRPYVTTQQPKKGHLCNGNLIQGKKTVYTIGFVSNIDIPTRLPRKKIKIAKLNRIAITDVRYEPNGEMGNCIMVDSDDGLYLVGEQLIPTHNSVFFSEILNLYDMFLFPHRKILIESSNQDQANRILGEILKIIQSNEWLNSKLTASRAEKISFNGGYILGSGFGTEIRGEHVDRIVVDDILRSDNKLTDNEIEDFLDMVLAPMLINRRGQLIIVGTPKSETDIFQTIMLRIKQGSTWKLEKFPAIVDYDTKVIQCPDRFTWDILIRERLNMGSLKFAKEFQLETFSREMSLFPSRIVDPAKKKGKEMVLMTKLDKRGPEWMIVAGVDVARSGSVSADFSTCIVIAYNGVTQEKQILHFWRSKGLKISEQAAQIADISKRFNHPMFLVEQNNMGQDMIDELVDTWNVYVESFVTGGRGQKKDELIRFLIQAFEHEQMVIPQGDEYTLSQMEILNDELSKFCVTTTPAGNERFEGVGAHDDTIIALALANRATQIGGLPFAVSSSRNDSIHNGHANMYKAIMKESSKHETDLVNKIRMGILK